MADLDLIDSKLGLYIKINVNNGQNKFEVHISINVAKMAILWPKIGQRHFGARASHGHNLAIFHQILTNEHTKMTSSLRRIEWNKILSSISLFYILFFLAPFLLRGLTWAMLYVWTKNYPQVVGTCSGHHGQLISQNCVLTKIRAEPPPPPPPLKSTYFCFSIVKLKNGLLLKSKKLVSLKAVCQKLLCTNSKQYLYRRKLSVVQLKIGIGIAKPIYKDFDSINMNGTEGVYILLFKIV